MNQTASIMDETAHLCESAQAELIYAGLVFVTVYQKNGREYCGRLIARDWDHVEDRAAFRGLNETVAGRLLKSISWPAD